MPSAELKALQKRIGYTTPKPTQPKKQSGRGGTLTSLISEAGGAGGALGGAAVGTAILPGVGTILGAGIGGALGGFGGSAAEQKVRDNKVNYKKAAAEAAVSGVTGGFTPGRAAAKVAQMGAKQVESKAAKSGGTSLLSKIGKTGDTLRQDVVNPKVAPSVGGAQKEAEIAKRVSKVKGLSSKGKYENLQGEVSGIGSKIEPQLAKTKKTVGSDSLLSTIRSNAEQSSHFLAGDDTYEKQLGSVLADLSAKTGGSKKLTASQLYGYKKGMDMSSVFNKLEKGADLNPKEASRLAVWTSLDDAITKAAPGVKSLTKEQSLLIQGAPGLKKSAEKTFGVPLLGIKSRKVEQGIQAGRELAGRGLQKVGEVSPGAASPSLFGRSTIMKPAAAQVGASAVLGPQDQPSTAPVDTPNLELPVDTATSSPEPSTHDVKQQALDMAIMQALSSGDTKGLSNLLAVAEYYDKQKAATDSSSKGLNSTASGVVADTETGLQSLASLSDQIANSNANNPGIGQLRSKNPFDTNAQNLQASVATAKQIVGKALEGGVLRKEDEAKYAKLLPTMGDTDAVAQHKIQALTSLIQQRLSIYKQSLSDGSGGLDTATLGL
jgi:hypothetical protein